MKLIHTSDVHIASPMTSRLSPIKAKERAREIINTFRQTVSAAERDGACGFIIAGDLFDNERVGIRVLDSIIGIIEGAPDVTFFYLPGNHEKSRLSASGVRIPENLKIFGEEWTYFTLGELTLAGRSSTSEDMLSRLEIDKDRKNILVLHGELADKSQEGGKIGQAELAALPVDYVAMGHYHSYSATKISDRCTAVYCGTPEGRGFDEVGDKGYVEIDIIGDTLSHKFKKCASRTLHICEVDVGGTKREIEVENRVAQRLSTIPACDLVRVVLVGEHEPGLVRDLDAISERFCHSFYYFEIKDCSRLRISAEDYKNDRSLKGEFIRLVLSEEGLSDKMRESIIECGLRALTSEGLD